MFKSLMTELPNTSQDFPGEIHQTPTGGVLLSNLDDLINWARSNSLWPLVFGTSCCAIEMMSAAAAKYDWSRFGFEVARATPRQADVIIIAGTIVNKMAPVLKRLYDESGEWLNINITPADFLSTVDILRNKVELNFDYMFCLTCVDWKTHLTMVYHLESTQHKHIIVVKSKLDRNRPEIETVSHLWK